MPRRGIGGGGKLGIGMDERNFFVERQAREQIIHTGIHGLVGVQVKRRAGLRVEIEREREYQQ